MLVRYLNLVFILAVVIGAAYVFDMKIAAERSSEKVSALKRQIDEERDAIRLLKAEWSLLNQPQRLQGLSERYADFLQLQPLEPRQIVRLEELPVKPVMLEPVGIGGIIDSYAEMPVTSTSTTAAATANIQ